MRTNAAVLAAICLAVPAGSFAAEPEERIDPQALEIAKSAAQFLIGHDRMAFDWFVTHDTVVDGREKITHIRSGSNMLVRGEGFFSVTERGDLLRDYYYDGETFTIAAPEEGFYGSAAFDGGFEALLEAVRERTGTELPVWSLMSEDLGKDALEGIEGAAYLGTTLVAGQEAHHLAFSEYDEDWQLWISTEPDRPVPLMIIGTDPYQQGWPQYRLHLTHWEFDPEVQAGSFVFTPGADDVKSTLPSLVPTARELATEAGTPGADDVPGADTQTE